MSEHWVNSMGETLSDSNDPTNEVENEIERQFDFFASTVELERDSLE